MKYDRLLEDLKKDCLVIDIETSSFDYKGNPVEIKNIDKYIGCAKVKWFGAYSYANDKTYLLNYQTDADKILELLENHDVLVGFNLEDFDIPILENNGLLDSNKKYTIIDCMVILGKSSYKTKNGYSYKNKGTLMGYDFRKNSLRSIANNMELSTQKGDIDYKVFYKNSWSSEETNEIKKYLKGDILATKQMFDKIWDFWKPFTEMLDVRYIRDLSWIRSSIASLIYKSACSLLGVKPTYSDKKSKLEKMGGRVIIPKYEEARNVWYVDFTSLYPHIFYMFNLLAETDYKSIKTTWHGNDVFKVRGYYDISRPHLLSAQIKSKLKERIELKKKDKENPMVYALKIWLNSLYGCVRSPIFEQVHTPNAGWDCCWLGQQIHKLTEIMLDEFGFETIYGDTDSAMLIAKEKKYNNEKYVKECLNKIINKINKNVPFPIDTFDIKIEGYLKYAMFPFSEQPIIDEKTGEPIKEKNRLVRERKGRKKNYLYITEEDGVDTVKLVGLPITKQNATYLGIKIYNEVLEPKILAEKTAKFSKDFINKVIDEYLDDPKIMKLIAREFKVKPFDTYKRESQIQAQISKNYLNGGSGNINLIKNKKIGKVGKGMKYCTIEEAIENKLKTSDLDLEKLNNELEPFVKFENKEE
ncbi:MAG: hypothetical protein ACOC56_07025 [Atribacterota bacterium]